MNTLSKLSIVFAIALLTGCAAEASEASDPTVEADVKAPATASGGETTAPARGPSPDPWTAAVQPPVLDLPGEPSPSLPVAVAADPVTHPAPVPRPGGPVE